MLIEYRFYRRALAMAGCALVSLLLTFWSHYHLVELEHHQEQPHPHRHGGPVDTVLEPRHLRRPSPHPHTHKHNQTSTTTTHPPPAATTTTTTTAPRVIHIVYTRFMQHQSNLTSLGLARMELFQAFFLRSLSRQSTSNFIVVIRADPDLHPSVRDPLIQLLEEQATFHYLLIGTNDNAPHSHQYFDLVRRLDETLSSVVVWSGNETFVRDYLNPLHHFPHRLPLVIETRLDSDDGLHRDYLEYLQQQALDVLADDDDRHHHHHHSRSWRISCAGRYMEWQMVAPWDEEPQPYNNNNHNNNDTGVGSLVCLQLNECISAGLSIAYYPSINSSNHNTNSNRDWVDDRIDVPTLQNHERIASTIRRCRSFTSGAIKHRTNCVDFVDLAPSVVRARTPTSAGMMNVLWEWNTTTSTTTTTTTNALYETYKAGARKQQPYQDELWKIARNMFGLSSRRVRQVKTFLTDHMAAIAQDNLQGQCRAGHSCKNGTRIILQQMSAIHGGVAAATTTGR
jgi:hypothetical protein